jgi:hypothetical protein
MELRFRYVRDRAAAAHVWDHINDRQDHALCGHAYQDPRELEVDRRPKRVCRGCQVLLPQAETALWRQQAIDASKGLRSANRAMRQARADYETLWTDYEAYTRDYETLRVDFVSLQRDYDSLHAEHQNLHRDHEQLALHADNQRRHLAQLQKSRPSKSPRSKPTTPPSGMRKSANQAQAIKKQGAVKVNPGRRVPSGRPRVKLWS